MICLNLIIKFWFYAIYNLSSHFLCVTNLCKPKSAFWFDQIWSNHATFGNLYSTPPFIYLQFCLCFFTLYLLTSWHYLPTHYVRVYVQQHAPPYTCGLSTLQYTHTQICFFLTVSPSHTTQQYKPPPHTHFQYTHTHTHTQKGRLCVRRRTICLPSSAFFFLRAVFTSVAFQTFSVQLVRVCVCVRVCACVWFLRKSVWLVFKCATKGISATLMYINSITQSIDIHTHKHTPSSRPV